MDESLSKEASEDLSNFEWLRRVYPFSDHDWHNEIVIRMYDLPNFEFYKKRSEYSRATINPKDIKGIEYAWAYNSYNQITWKQLLNMLRRFDWVRRNKTTYKDLVDHALNDYKEARTVYKIGSEYITTTGQHRLALCKFLDIEEIEVDVIEYDFQQEKFNQHCLQKSFLASLKDEGFIDENEYAKALTLDSHFLAVRIAGVFFMIENHILKAFWNHYQKSRITWYTNLYDSINSYLFGSIDNYTNNDLRKEDDILRYKRFFRDLKRKKIRSKT